MRTVDDRDRRVARVSVSEGGRARLDQSRSRRDAWLARRLAEVTPDEIARVAAPLAVLEALAAGTARRPSPPPPTRPSEPSQRSRRRRR